MLLLCLHGEEELYLQPLCEFLKWQAWWPTKWSPPSESGSWQCMLLVRLHCEGPCCQPLCAYCGLAGVQLCRVSRQLRQGYSGACSCCRPTVSLFEQSVAGVAACRVWSCK